MIIASLLIVLTGVLMAEGYGGWSLFTLFLFICQIARVFPESDHPETEHKPEPEIIEKIVYVKEEKPKEGWLDKRERRKKNIAKAKKKSEKLFEWTGEYVPYDVFLDDDDDD